MDEPAVPPRPGPGEPRSDDVKSEYVGQLRAAGTDCRDTVAETRERKAAYTARYERETESPIRRFFRFGR